MEIILELFENKKIIAKEKGINGLKKIDEKLM